MSYNKPLPRPDTLNGPFWAGAKEGKLLLQKCPSCGDVRFPPGPICPKCLADGQVWVEASGKGTLESWIDMHRAYWDGFNGRSAVPRLSGAVGGRASDGQQPRRQNG